jgi:hypothetical protein
MEMGFFSVLKSIGRTIGSTLEKVGEWTGFDLVKYAGRGLRELCEEKTNELADQTSKTDMYDKEKARLEETRRINEILSNYSLSLASQADELEKGCLQACKVFFAYLIHDLEQEKQFRINTNRLKRAFKEIERNVIGGIKKHLAKRVSLDDTECLQILKMPQGENKKLEMNRFANKVFKEALEQLSDQIRTIVSEQQDYVEEVLQEKTDEIIQIVQQQLSELEEIERMKQTNEQDFLEKKEQLKLGIQLCELALTELDKVS